MNHAHHHFTPSAASRVSAFVLAAAALLGTLVSGCTSPNVRNVRDITAVGRVELVERGQWRQLEVARVRFDAGIGGIRRRYLTASVPSIDNDREVHALVERSPPHRITHELMRVNSLLGRSENYPWNGRQHWFVGNDPFVIAIGGRQGESPHHPAFQYPFVGPGDREQQVTHLIAFDDNTWPRLRRAKEPDDVLSVPHRVMTLPEPITLAQVMERRPWLQLPAEQKDEHHQ